MKPFLKFSFLFAVLLLVASSSKAQTLHISYDAAGNRVLLYTDSELKSLDVTQTSFDKNTKAVVHKFSVGANTLLTTTENTIDDHLQTLSTDIFGTNANTPQPFSVAPNPSKDVVILSQKSESGETTMYNLSLFDATGKLIKEFMTNNLPFTIDLAVYSSGLYFLKVSDKNTMIQTLKIVKL